MDEYYDLGITKDDFAYEQVVEEENERDKSVIKAIKKETYKN